MTDPVIAPVSVVPPVVPVTPPASDPGTTPPVTPPSDEVQDVKLLPKWAQDIIAETRTEAKTRRLALQELENKAKEKEEVDLAANKQFETLANQRGAELAALKPKAEQADQLSELLTAQINKEIDKWPAEVKATAPDGEVSALELVKWLDKARPLAQKLMQAESSTSQQKPVVSGNGRGPTPDGKGGALPQVPASTESVIDLASRF